MGLSREQSCKRIALWRGYICFCFVLLMYFLHITFYVPHHRAFSRNEQPNKRTHACMHVHTHTPALGSVWLFYLPVNPLFLESPQAVQTWPFTIHASIAPSLLHYRPCKSGLSFVPLVARLTPRLQNPFPSGNNLWKTCKCVNSRFPVIPPMPFHVRVPLDSNIL